MFFNKSRLTGNDYNECVARGNCAVSPEIRAIQEVILLFTHQLAFYELKQEEYNISYFENKDTLLESISALISTPEYTHEQLLEIVSKIYSKLLYARKEYLNYCTENNIKCSDIKLFFKLNPEMTLNEIIKSGEKVFFEKYKKISLQQKTLQDILIIAVKSICTNLLKLKEFNKFDDSAYKDVLTALNYLNYRRISSVKLQNITNKLAADYINLVTLLAEAQSARFGEISSAVVPLSTTQGKAILVSGSNLLNLYDILKSTENTGIDVYTHSDLMIAHAFKAFRHFPHLKGHFGSCFSNCIVDFATFPGAILLTKNTFPNVDYLYRGKLFSAEEIPPKGVIQIKNNDFTPLIEAALNSKGFSKGREMAPVTVGYRENELDEKLDNICKRFKSQEIKHLIIIGMSDFSGAQDEYFKKLHRLLEPDTYVITFSHHNPDRENELFINLVNNLPAVYSVMRKIFQKIDISSERLTFFLTKCDPGAVSNMINLHNAGAGQIFLSQCPSYIINPNIQGSLKNLYGIIPTTNPQNDIEKIYKS